MDLYRIGVKFLPEKGKILLWPNDFKAYQCYLHRREEKKKIKQRIIKKKSMTTGLLVKHLSSYSG